MSRLRVVDQPIDRLECEVAAALFFEDQRPLSGPAALLDRQLNGRLTDMLLAGGAQGRAGEHVLIQGRGTIEAPWIFFCGGGSWHGLSGETFRSLLRHLVAGCEAAGFRRLAVGLEPLTDLSSAEVSALAQEVLADAPSDLECFLTMG